MEFEVKAGAGLGVHGAHWPSGWEVCAGDPDGTSCLNPTNFPNKVSCLQSKLGLESAATVTFSSPQVVPSHSPPPLFVQAHPCLESQAMQPLDDPHSLSSLMVTVRSKQCQHGNVSLGTDYDDFHLSGHLKLELLYIMDDKSSDGEQSFLSFRLHSWLGLL